jgi:hypothetical protein
MLFYATLLLRIQKEANEQQALQSSYPTGYSSTLPDLMLLSTEPAQLE